MIRETFQEVAGKTGNRDALIRLKEELKQALSDGENKETLDSCFNGQYDIFYQLLKNEDPKIRKNTAQILGMISKQEFLEPLWNSYCKEETRFVKSAYLSAIGTLNYQELIEKLSDCRDKLLAEPVTPENKKHLTEELRMLEKLLRNVKGLGKHTFTGWKQLSELLLLTERSQVACTLQEFSELKIPCKAWNSGILVKTDRISEIFQIRTFREVLFFIPGMKTIPKEEKEAAVKIADSGLLKFLKERHSGQEPFYFRLELRSRETQETRIRFAKGLAMELEYASGRTLLNSTGNYEVEIRLVENREGSYTVMVKLMTLPDPRFMYRKEAVAASIRPNVAALSMCLSKNYLTPGAQVLDPFCGVGTMLIERSKCIPTGTMYGIDCFGKAIQGARENTKSAGITVNYINRDFFEFRHEYLFDEIITNLPFTNRAGDMRILEQLYQKFFQKAAGHLKKQGVLVLFTHNLELIQANSGVQYQIEEIFEISKKEGTYVCVLRLCSGVSGERKG